MTWIQDGVSYLEKREYGSRNTKGLFEEEEEEYVWDEMFMAAYEPSCRDNLDQLIKDMSDLESYLDKVEKDTMELHEGFGEEDYILQAFIDLKSPTKNYRYKRREAFLNSEAGIQKGVTHVYGVEVAKCKDLDASNYPLTDKLVSVGDLDRPPENKDGHYVESIPGYNKDGHHEKSNPVFARVEHYAENKLALHKDDEEAGRPRELFRLVARLYFCKKAGGKDGGDYSAPTKKGMSSSWTLWPCLLSP